MKKINCIEDIAEFRGKVVYVEIGWNRHKSGLKRIWDKDPIGFQYGSFGYLATDAVKEDGVHCSIAITDKDIEKGDVFIRLATKEEINNATPSYDEVWAT